MFQIHNSNLQGSAARPKTAFQIYNPPLAGIKTRPLHETLACVEATHFIWVFIAHNEKMEI